MPHPIIIQGGLGLAISGWPLARAVSRLGQLGSARRFQLNDPTGSSPARPSPKPETS
jgi:NAD(P)H-dependent flavin oxidoreductase YrpB (nitropropane dioxygenase family)